MIDIMMMIGPYPFGINTAAYTALRRAASWRWSRQSRVGRLPAMQYVGPDSQSVTLSGMILPYFRGGSYQVAAMRAVAGTGEPQLLVDGRGYVWGDYVITAIEESEASHLSSGAPQKIEFSMTIEEYGSDQASGPSVYSGADRVRGDATGGQTVGDFGTSDGGTSPLVIRFDQGGQ